jgi:hypothetical protein
MSTFGYYPGPIDYWMLVTDWRNGSIAIMLAIGALIVGYKFRTAVLPTHASPAIAEGEVDEGDDDARPLCRKWPPRNEPKSGALNSGTCDGGTRREGDERLDPLRPMQSPAPGDGRPRLPRAIRSGDRQLSSNGCDRQGLRGLPGPRPGR